MEHSQGWNLIRIEWRDPWRGLSFYCAARQSSKKTLIPLGCYCLWNNDLLMTKIEAIIPNGHSQCSTSNEEKNNYCLIVARYKDLLTQKVYESSGVSVSTALSFISYIMYKIRIRISFIGPSLHTPNKELDSSWSLVLQLVQAKINRKKGKTKSP